MNTAPPRVATGPGYTDVKLMSFHLFPELPIELRLKIWKLAATEMPAQVVCIQPTRRHTPFLRYSTHVVKQGMRISILEASMP